MGSEVLPREGHHQGTFELRADGPRTHAPLSSASFICLMGTKPASQERMVEGDIRQGLVSLP